MEAPIAKHHAISQTSGGFWPALPRISYNHSLHFFLYQNHCFQDLLNNQSTRYLPWFLKKTFISKGGRSEPHILFFRLIAMALGELYWQSLGQVLLVPQF